VFHFRSFIGIDYSGAQKCDSPLKGLRVFEGSLDAPPCEVRVTSDGRTHWSRQGVALWLVNKLSSNKHPCFVGIDHGFSFPVDYFSLHGINQDWDSFLDDFVHYWPTQQAGISVADLLRSQKLKSPSRLGESRWRRLTEQRSRGAKSVFHFAVPGSVASSTHAGLSWIHFLRSHPQLKNKVHFWPFDGWLPAEEKSVVAEVYPSLWNKNFPINAPSQDQHDAWVVAHMLRSKAVSDELMDWFDPERWNKIRLSQTEREIASFEGWILGLN